MSDDIQADNSTKTSRSNDAVHMAEAEVKVDLRSPEFILAATIVGIFAAALFVFKSEQLQTALISAVSIAVSYFLNTQRHRKVDPK
jgi:hypothetical protein